MAYKLSDKVLNPESIEKTNVSLADACFHESTIYALKYYAKHGYDSFSETADILQIFRNWFNAVNVKSLYSVKHTRDSFRSAITKEDRGMLEFFSQFSLWLDKWISSGQAGLSKQTFAAASQTTKVLIDLPNYLLDEKNLDFILLGFLQSDALEGRFGWYRQSSGANYHISVLQVVQSEKVIRTRSLIDQGFNMSEVKEIFSSTTTGETIKSEADFLTDNLNIQMENIQFHKEIQQEEQSIIYYVAGAIVRIVLKKTKCEKCREFLCAGNMPLNSEHIQDNEVRKEFTAQMSRGGLLKPSDIVCHSCIFLFSVN